MIELTPVKPLESLSGTRPKLGIERIQPAIWHFAGPDGAVIA